MNVSHISIGNSKGIRLSKAIIEKYNLKDSVELILEKGYIILKPKTVPRKNWEKSFKKMNNNNDDKILMPDIFDDEKIEE